MTAKPALRMITPNTTPEEIAAIVAVLGAMGGGGAGIRPRAGSVWAARQRSLRRPHFVSSWRNSRLPS